jgi:hypothetical protein
VPHSTEPAEPDRVLVVPERVPLVDRARTANRPWMAEDYLVVDLSDACDAMSLPMRMKYESDDLTFTNSTRDAAIKLWPTREYGSVRLFVPVYQFVDGGQPARQGVRFKGLELPAKDLPCLAGLKRVPKSADAPLWLDLSLSRLEELCRLPGAGRLRRRTAATRRFTCRRRGSSSRAGRSMR